MNGSMNGDVVSHAILAKKYKSLSDEKVITLERLSNIISRARVFMELKHGTTIINIRGRGYKLATPDELALQTAKWVKRTIMYADRTYRLVDITDRRKIPGALKAVFEDSQGRIKTLSTRGRKFIQSFTEYSNKQRQLEAKNVKATQKAS
jgi:DNA-binding winged helix-turn-helix (wHTH) protein